MAGRVQHINHVDDLIQVIEDNRGIIYKVVSSYCTDPNDQEDLVQEIMVHLLEGFERFNHQSKVTTWIYRVALNVSISFYRKSKTRRKYISPMPDKIIQVRTDENDENMNQDVIKLRQFIQNLDELNRAVMIMYLDGNSHEDIADVLAISESNVGTKIHRIKKKLKEQFETA